MNKQTVITETYAWLQPEDGSNKKSLVEPEYIEYNGFRFHPELQNTFMLNTTIIAVWKIGIVIGPIP